MFKKFDSDFKGDLDFNEFTKLIRGIAPRISSDDIKLVNIFKKKILIKNIFKLFEKFDKDANKIIDFKEFKALLE